MKIVLLPGMDGSGDLFTDFVRALPGELETVIVRYPSDVYLSYPELMEFVKSGTPDRDPFVLVAESFSTPLAIQFAATVPANLKGLILCAGFASCPVRNWLRSTALLLAPVLFLIKLPRFAATFWLVGSTAPSRLPLDVAAAISSVRPKVLSARLRAVFRCDVRMELNRIDLPILYIQAKQDRLISASALEEMRQIKPQSSVVTIPGPHLIFQREPQKTAEIVARFVSRFS